MSTQVGKQRLGPASLAQHPADSLPHQLATTRTVHPPSSQLEAAPWALGEPWCWKSNLIRPCPSCRHHCPGSRPVSMEMTGHSSLLPIPPLPVLGRKLCAHPGDFLLSVTHSGPLLPGLWSGVLWPQGPALFPSPRTCPHLPRWVTGQRGWLAQDLSLAGTLWHSTHLPCAAQAPGHAFFLPSAACRSRGCVFSGSQHVMGAVETGRIGWAHFYWTVSQTYCTSQLGDGAHTSAQSAGHLVLLPPTPLWALALPSVEQLLEEPSRET